MTFTIAQIDRSFEWRLLDKIIALGYWADQRAFLISQDEAAYQAALALIDPQIKVFGAGNYTDREQLTKNNVIIDRIEIMDGDVGVAYPYRFEYNQVDKNYDKIRTPDATSHIEYEVRFVCDDTALDRVISQIMLDCFTNKTFLKGINDNNTLTLTEEGYWVEKRGAPVDLSATNFIERVWRFVVSDVNLGTEVIETADIAPVTQIDIIQAPGDIDSSTDQLRVPVVTAASVESGSADDLVVNFDVNVKLSAAPLLLPVAFLVNGSPKTDLAGVTLSGIKQVTLNFTAPFSAGEVITWDYTRDLSGEAIIDAVNDIEMEALKTASVSNNL